MGLNQPPPPSAERARQALRSAGRRRSFDRRQTLIRMGERTEEVLLIESGAVKVTLPTDNGWDVLVGLYGRGHLVGELAALHNQPRSATILGHRDGTVIQVDGGRFRELLHDNRDVRALVDAMHQVRTRNADRRQVALATMDVRSRVLAQLSEWAEQYGERVPGGVEIYGLNHRDLASAVLARSEKHVDEVLRELRDAGRIRTGRLRFVLLDVDS